MLTLAIEGKAKSKLGSLSRFMSTQGFHGGLYYKAATYRSNETCKRGGKGHKKVPRGAPMACEIFELCV